MDGNGVSEGSRRICSADQCASPKLWLFHAAARDIRVATPRWRPTQADSSMHEYLE